MLSIKAVAGFKNIRNNFQLIKQRLIQISENGEHKDRWETDEVEAGNGSLIQKRASGVSFSKVHNNGVFHFVVP